MKVIDDALSAKDLKVHYDTDEGKWKYSKHMPDHITRLKAAQLVVEWAEAAPPKELNVRHTGSVISKELEDAARIALDVMVKELEG